MAGLPLTLSRSGNDGDMIRAADGQGLDNRLLHMTSASMPHNEMANAGGSGMLLTAWELLHSRSLPSQQVFDAGA